MKKLALGLCAVVIGVSMLRQTAAAAMPPFHGVPEGYSNSPFVVGYPQAHPYYLAPQAHNVDFGRIVADSRAQKSMPMWANSIQVGGHTYDYAMVGTSPFTSPVSTTIPVQIQLLVFSFSDGSVFDPTQGACGDSVSVIDRTLMSPLFTARPIKSNGVHVGNVQYEDSFQRSEFWSVVKGTNYHVMVKNLTKNMQVVDVTVPSNEGQTYTASTCAGKFGVVNINWLSNNVLTPLSNKWKPKQFQLVYMYDVFQSGDGKIDQCCVLGYHGGYGSPMQTYGTAAYNDPGIFSVPIEDIHATTHEVGEWMNDPSGGNPTPAWGHIGQVSGCQNNLEVGDPLTGTVFANLKLNGMTYHPQELAFFSWFYRQTPSMGTGGLYSNAGTFTAPQGTC